MTDKELLALFREDPQYALRISIEEYGAMVRRVAEQRLPGNCVKEDIEECISDVFAALYRSFDKIDPERGSVSSYIAVMARNTALRRAREISNRRMQEEALSDDLPETGDFTQRADNSELWKLVLSLGKPDSDMIILKYFYGYKSREIAKALGIRHNTVDKRISRALEKLKRSLLEREG